MISKAFINVVHFTRPIHSPKSTIPFLKLIWDDFEVQAKKMGIISGSVSFRGQFGDLFFFRVGDHFKYMWQIEGPNLAR